MRTMSAAVGICSFPLAVLAQEAGPVGSGNGWVLFPSSTDVDQPDGETAERHVQELFDGSADLATKASYCDWLLREAERAVAKKLPDMSYTLTITAKGTSPSFPGDIECALSAIRTVEIGTKPLETKD